MKLSIIIPVYNEEKTVDEIIKKVENVNLPYGLGKEIIVVDDGSTDSSRFKIQSLKFKGLKKLFHEKNRGKGAAVRSGLKVTTGDYVIIQDADLEYDPLDYIKLLNLILKNNSKVVYGTRLIDYPLKFWGKDKTVLPLHLVANRALTYLTNLLYGSNLTDMETCYKLFRSDILKNINLKADGFDFEPEITAKILRRGINILEVPIKTNPRTYKEGKKISWIDGFVAIGTLFKYRLMK